MSVLENFKNIPRSPYGGATGLKCNFFPSNLQRSPWRKKRGGLSPPQRATGACRPPLGRQGPVARWGGDMPPLFFFLQGLLCKFEEKKLHLSPVAPHRVTGVYF